MDTIPEKKWFVYVGDRHEGPFSVEEIQKKMTQGRVSVENFVWTEGMQDWKVMMEVSDFGPIPVHYGDMLELDPEPEDIFFAPPIAQEKAIEHSPEPVFQSSPSAELASVAALPPSVEAPPLTESTLLINLDQDVQPKRIHSNKTTSKPATRKKTATRKGKKWIGIGFLLLSGAILILMNQKISNFIQRTPELRATYDAANEFSRPYLLRLAEKVPAVGKWVSPIPALESVSADDYEELKTAAQDKLETGGSRFAIALSRANPSFPTFYISSNLPDGASFQVYIVGISNTLMSQISFSTQTEVTLTKKLAVTPIIRFPDGKPIPRGEYVIYVTPSETQSPLVKSILSTAQLLNTKLPPELPKSSRVLTYKTYFLGGERDTTYLSRLNNFHDMLRAKASDELTTINQYAVTLEHQLLATHAKFELLQNGKITLKQRKSWDQFHTEWKALQTGLNQTIQKWTPDAIQNEFFYGILFTLTQQTEQAIEKAHEFQHAYFTKTSDLKTLQIQIGEATSSAQSILSLLRSKIEQAEKLSPTPNGMPRREGL